MRYFSADLLFTGTSAPVKHAILVVDEDGTIAGISESVPEGAEVSHFEGALCPGFVNMHGHLELAGMKQRIPKGRGLTAFLQEVVRSREETEPDPEAMEEAEKEMIRNGIVAAADISNTDASFKLKRRGNLYYHTFIELFGLSTSHAQKTFDQGRALAGIMPAAKVSVTPHAPYSLSRKLFELIGAHAGRTGEILSIHNQESEAENEWFEFKSGPFTDFFKSMHIETDPSMPSGLRPLPCFLPLLPRNNKLLLVHNTYCNADDIRYAESFSEGICWCFCPRANLYIEEALPDFSLFAREHMLCCVGTDSYASNSTLSILEELKTIGESAPSIGLETLVRWATLNGAEFLGIEGRYGSFAPGKKPGVNLIRNIDLENVRLTRESAVESLV